MKISIIKKSKILVVVGIITVASLAVGAGLVHKTSVQAAATPATTASQAETNDSNTDDAKDKTVQTGDVQDNGQVGETTDNTAQ